MGQSGRLEMMIEPVPVEDDLCTELAMVEELEMGARLVMVHRQSCYEQPGTSVLVVKRKIVLPLSAVRPGIERTLAFLARRDAGASGQLLLRLLR